MNRNCSRLVLVLMLFNSKIAFAQDSPYRNIINCFEGGRKDSIEIELSEIGETTAYSVDVEDDISMLYFIIPKKHKSIKTEKILSIAAYHHINTWKNNTGDLYLREHNFHNHKKAIEVRIHLFVEDIWMQIVLVRNKNIVYEIMSFCDPGDLPKCDKIVSNLLNGNCP